MIIRQETKKDFEDIYEFVKVAFQTAKESDGDEQDYVNTLRAGNKYLPKLAFVMEEDNTIIGHVMLTKLYIDGKDERALLLAPLAVQLEYRNQQVGSKLVNEALRLAKDKGYTSVFLVGDPKYYQRFGFVKSTTFAIGNVNDIPEQYVQGMELIEGALTNITGNIDFL